MKLIIVRGIPGSGKSTIARRYEAAGFVHVESDMYFMRDGEYKFDATKLHTAHQWCQNEVQAHLEAGQEVVVSNTFTRLWEMEKYLEMAERLNIEDVKVLKVVGDWGSVHGVPEEALKRMNDRWQDYEFEILIENYKDQDRGDQV